MKTLYVGNLSPSTTEQMIWDAFAQFGIVACTLVKNNQTGRSKCVAIVDIENDMSAQEAIQELNYAYIDDTQIEVRDAVPDEELDALDAEAMSQSSESRFGANKRFESSRNIKR